MYTPKQINDLKSRPELIEMVRAAVPSLDQVGAEFKGCCPFHSEKTPSFTVRDADGVWLFHCFGCQKNGNLIQFCQYVNNISFNEAVEKVAAFLGWKEGKKNVESTFKAIKEEKEPLTFPLIRIEEARCALRNSEAGRSWFASRGITLNTAETFRLGFVQSARAVNAQHPRVDGGWILFPTLVGDKVTALKYRSVVEKEFLYKTGMKTSLYNLSKIDPFEDVFLVEGEVDCLTMAQAGYVAVSLPGASYNPTGEEKDELFRANRIILAGDMDNAGQQAMTKLWTELRERTYRLSWPSGMKDANQTFLEYCAGDVEKFRAEVERLKKKALESPMPFMHDLRESLGSADDQKPMENPSRLRMPWTNIDSWTAILPGDVVAVTATETGTGKALANGTPVLTLHGWRAVEDLNTGDHVFGVDGQKTKVLGVFPQGDRELFKVTFSCGTEVVCDADHFWTVETSNHNRKITVSTVDLKSRIDKKQATKNSKSYPWKVPEIAPVQFLNNAFALHPYLVGALIGDGGLTHTSAMFSTNDEEILERVRKFLPEDIEARHVHGCDYRLSRKGYLHEKVSWFRLTLANLGLLGKKSENKFIPICYMFGSVDQRLELLRGLLDTDGTVDRKTGAVSFSTSSPRLAQDVRNLIFSLGGFASITNKKTKCLPAFIVSINMAPEIRLFWLSRKNVLASGRKGWRRVRAVESIKQAGRGLATCIKVAAPDGLFLTKDFIPTHNTSWIMDILLENAVKYDKTVVNYSAEVLPAQYSRRAAAYLVQKPKDELSREDFDRAAELMKDARFYNGYKPGANYKEVIELLTWAKRRLGADILVVDHLHFLTRSERDETKAQSEAMRLLKDMALDFNCIVIVVGQPRKPLANHRGREAVTQDMKGSESFGSDASQVFILHRDRKSNGDDENMPIFDPVCKIKLDKSRESEPRATKLFFDGARCTFGMLERNFNEYEA